jgi:RNA polymerase sigma-70 factor (ECF subfamily)
MSPTEFKSTIHLYKNKLYRFALGIVGHDAVAEDVVQEVFIRLWKQCQKDGNIQNPEAWCMATTRNLSIDKVRSKYRKAEPLKSGFDLIDASATPFETAVENDLLRTVKELIDKLPENWQASIRLRDIENYSYQEIAEILGITLEQVKTNIFRGRQSLRQSLEKLKLYQTA